MAGLTKSLGEPDGRDFLIVDEPGGGSFEQQFLRVKQLVREMHRQGKAVGGGLSSQNAYLDQDGKCMIVENNSYNPTFIIHEAPATLPPDNSLLDLYIVLFLALVTLLLICLAFYAVYKLSKHLRDAKPHETQHQVYGRHPTYAQPPGASFLPPQGSGQFPQQHPGSMNLYFLNHVNIDMRSPVRTHSPPGALARPFEDTQQEDFIAQDLHGPPIRSVFEESRGAGPVRRVSDEAAARPNHLLAISTKPEGASEGPAQLAQADRVSRSLDRLEAPGHSESREAKDVPLSKLKSALPKVGGHEEEQSQEAVNLQHIQQLIKADTRLKKNKPIFTDCHQQAPEPENKLNSIPMSEHEEEPPLENGKFKKSFQEAQFIGEGSYGEVYRAIHKLDKKAYAIKKIRIRQQDLSDWTASKVFREVMAMANTQHENIVRFITCWLENGEGDQAAEDLEKSCVSDSRLQSSRRSKSMDGLSLDMSRISAFLHPEPSSLSRNKSNHLERSGDGLSIRFGEASGSPWQANKAACKSRRKASHNPIKFINLFIQMEYCAMKSLDKLLEKNSQSLTRENIFSIFWQTLKGVMYIHENGIIHRDLKPGNIYVDGKNSIKIGDFGLALLQQATHHQPLSSSRNLNKSVLSFSKNKMTFSTETGTPLYASPEQMKNGLYNNKSDVYSLGIILFELVGRFRTTHRKQSKILALREKGLIDECIRDEFPEETLLIQLMTKKEIDERPSTAQLIKSAEMLRYVGTMEHLYNVFEKDKDLDPHHTVASDSTQPNPTSVDP